ncbi:MAG: hypothetical protein HC828_15100 [Blastochloris sp.]|nr:hypothetical protein [Blastochloris sp.]
MQPSAADILNITAELRENIEPPLATRSRTVAIPQADIHPVVFLHGILGSMPPQDTRLSGPEEMRTVLDPFLGVYWPLIQNLEKMGYEWNKSLFPITYDWRQSNNDSALFLAQTLTEITSLTQDITYIDNQGPDAGDADLIVHSMGGLVSRAYIQSAHYQQDVRKIIFIASPHKGFPYNYRTWEGMTWSGYLDNAPLFSGSRTLSLGMNVLSGLLCC